MYTCILVKCAAKGIYVYMRMSRECTYTSHAHRDPRVSCDMGGLSRDMRKKSNHRALLPLLIGLFPHAAKGIYAHVTRMPDMGGYPYGGVSPPPTTGAFHENAPTYRCWPVDPCVCACLCVCVCVCTCVCERKTVRYIYAHFKRMPPYVCVCVCVCVCE